MKVRVLIEKTNIAIGEAVVTGDIITMVPPPPVFAYAAVTGNKITIWHSEGHEVHLRMAGLSPIFKAGGAGRQLAIIGLRQLLHDIESAEPADDSKSDPPVYDRIVEIEVPDSYLLPVQEEAM